MALLAKQTCAAGPHDMRSVPLKSDAQSDATIYQVGVVNYCFTSLFGTNSHLSDIVLIR